MSNFSSRVSELKNRVVEAERKKATLEGRKQALEQQLFGLETSLREFMGSTHEASQLSVSAVEHELQRRSAEIDGRLTQLAADLTSIEGA